MTEETDERKWIVAERLPDGSYQGQQFFRKQADAEGRQRALQTQRPEATIVLVAEGSAL